MKIRGKLKNVILSTSTTALKIVNYKFCYVGHHLRILMVDKIYLRNIRLWCALQNR